MSEAERATKIKKNREKKQMKKKSHTRNSELGQAGAALGLWKCGCFLGRFSFFFLVAWAANKAKFNWQLKRQLEEPNFHFFLGFLVNGAINSLV